MKLFAKEEMEKVIHLEKEVIDVVEKAFTDLVKKEVQMPPIMRIDVPEYNGEVDIKSAYVAGYDSFAVKLSSGFFDNYKLGLPSASGMMLLLSSETGIPQAVLADNGYLTEMRTAAAGAVAAKHMAKEKINTAGVIGTGAQARYQVKALKLVRDFDHLLVYGRTPEKAAAYKAEMERELGINVTISSSAEEMVRASDVIITTTPATTPVIKAEWLHPGLHITAMGSDAEHKQELESSVLEKADMFVCDVIAQSTRLGELRACHSQRVIDEAIELGEITAGDKKGRNSENQITICDLTGTGIQDTAIARYAYERLTK
ncbi:cyclodeaminase [Thalassobacillus devorans]|uniref:cyclodeaminase n=1 Tax=Thalassobacillus devorans TaxID=279813 RepID=UPI000A1CA039|nr:cyclodeaminase [Thalassobacillus devorans]